MSSEFILFFRTSVQLANQRNREYREPIEPTQTMCNICWTEHGHSDDCMYLNDAIIFTDAVSNFGWIVIDIVLSHLKFVFTIVEISIKRRNNRFLCGVQLLYVEQDDTMCFQCGYPHMYKIMDFLSFWTKLNDVSAGTATKISCIAKLSAPLKIIGIIANFVLVSRKSTSQMWCYEYLIAFQSSSISSNRVNDSLFAGLRVEMT